MVDPSTSSDPIHLRGKPPPRSPETIPVNAAPSKKMEPSGTKKPTLFDPALLNSSLQELDDAVASIAVDSLPFSTTSTTHQRSRQSAASTTHHESGGSQISEIGSVLFHQHQQDKTNYVIDNMERVAKGVVAFPPISRSSSRRSRSSRSSRKRGLSLERLISETILKTASSGKAHFCSTDDATVDSNASSTLDILKDLRQINQVIAVETGASVGSASSGSGGQRRTSPPPSPPTTTTTTTTTTTGAEPPMDAEERKPATRSVVTENLLPQIDTEDEEPSLLPPDEWTPDWGAAAPANATGTTASLRPQLPDPPAVNKSNCTDDTDPETINNSMNNEKSFQSATENYSQSLFGDDKFAFPEWPPVETVREEAAVDNNDDEWTPFETAVPFCANPFEEQTATANVDFDPLSFESPSSIVQIDWEAQHQQTASFTSKQTDEWGPWSGSLASF